MNDASFMIITGIFFGVFAFFGAYFGANLALSRWKFKLKYDKEKNEIVIETEKKPLKIIPKITEHAEFLGEATQEELDEMNKPSKLKKFMSRFSKPGK